MKIARIVELKIIVIRDGRFGKGFERNLLGALQLSINSTHNITIKLVRNFLFKS